LYTVQAGNCLEAKHDKLLRISVTISMQDSPSWKANSHSATQQIHRFYGTLTFITLFIRPRYWSLYWARWNQSTPPNPISWRSILILSSSLRLGLLSGLYFQDLRPIFCMYFSSFSCVLYALSSHVLLFNHPNNIWWSVQVMKILTMQSSPVSRQIFSTSPCSQTPSTYAPPLVWKLKPRESSSNKCEWNYWSYRNFESLFCAEGYKLHW